MEQLRLLMDYTRFHIGVYVALVTAAVGGSAEAFLSGVCCGPAWCFSWSPGRRAGDRQQHSRLPHLGVVQQSKALRHGLQNHGVALVGADRAWRLLAGVDDNLGAVVDSKLYRLAMSQRLRCSHGGRGSRSVGERGGMTMPRECGGRMKGSSRLGCGAPDVGAYVATRWAGCSGGPRPPRSPAARRRSGFRSTARSVVSGRRSGSTVWRRCWPAALLAVAVWPAHAHESDTTAGDCLEQAVVGDRWHVGNACDYMVQASWCIDEGRTTCAWHTPTMLSAGDSYSTGRLASQPLRTRFAGCRSELPDYGGMATGVDWRTAEYKCVVAVPGAGAVGGSGAEDANPHSRCMEPVAHASDGALALRNRCDYAIGIAWCGLEGWPEDDPLRCGADPDAYYTMVSEVLPGDSKHMHNWETVDAVACRGLGYGSFDPDGFDGAGGYRCVDEDLKPGNGSFNRR